MSYQLNFGDGRNTEDTIREEMLLQDCDDLGPDTDIQLPEHYTLTKEQLENKRKRKYK